MVTLTRVKQLIPATDESITRLMSISNSAIINERVVADIVMQIKLEENLLAFCELFEQLVDPESRVHVEIFRNGTYYDYYIFLFIDAYYMLLSYS